MSGEVTGSGMRGNTTGKLVLLVEGRQDSSLDDREGVLQGDF